MDTRHDLQALQTAVPYIRAYKGRVFVIKLGGALCNPGPVLANLVDQIGVLHQLGVKVVVVHGGGEQMDDLCQRLGIQPRRVAGRRITDDAVLEAAKMVFAGSVNTNVLAAMRRARVPAVGLTGADGALITAHKRPPKSITDPSTNSTQQVDFGWVGDVDMVNVAVLQHLVDGGYVPVVCSLAADGGGQVYNVNADTIAARIAVEIHAAKYFSVTTVDGVMNNVQDRSTLHSYLDLAELESLVASGAVSGGMLPKLDACKDALHGGVSRVHVVNGLTADTLLAEVFTNEGAGTLLVSERERAGGPGAPETTPHAAAE